VPHANEVATGLVTYSSSEAMTATVATSISRAAQHRSERPIGDKLDGKWARYER